MQHTLFRLTFDDRLGTAPPNDPESKVGRVLDVGTGSGIWAIDYGDEHPNSEVGYSTSVCEMGFKTLTARVTQVRGIDLSAAQPTL